MPGPYSWIFTKDWGSWVAGQKIDPPCVLSVSQTRWLIEQKILVREDLYKEPKKRGRPPAEPVVETADAPPIAERAVLTSAPKPARMVKVKKDEPKEKGDDK